MSSSISWVTSRNPDANNVFAIAGVVIKEMYRRKDFYVLFVLMVVITIMLGSVSFFNDDRIVRYLKDACLLLIWISSLVIAITTAARQIPAERESRTIFPLLAKPVGRGEFVAGKFLGCWLACGIGAGGRFTSFSAVIVGLARTHAAGAGLYAGHVAALDLPGHCRGPGFAGLGRLHRALVQRHHLFHCRAGHLVRRRASQRVALQMRGFRGTVVYAIYYAIPHLEWYDVRELPHP